MNICFFSQEYPPANHSGGIGTYTHNTARALARLGHTVHVITSARHPNQTSRDNGIWVHHIRKPTALPYELRQLGYSFSAAKRWSRLDCHFDIVQSSEFAAEAFWFALTRRTPLVTRLATPSFLTEELNDQSFLTRHPFLNWMERKQTLLSDGVFTSTRALAEAVSGRWRIEPSRVEIIPNSVDIARVLRLGQEGLPPSILRNRDYLLYFGRLEERKGVRVLAQAFPAVLDEFPHISLVFVGSDMGHKGSSMRAQIRREAKGGNRRIIFFDNLPQQDLFPVVRSAKMVILPSLWEAFGFVCVEAMALGRPVIASSGSGFEEIIEDRVSGYLVEPGNSELLGKKIRACLADEKYLRRVSQKARERAQDFEVSQIAIELLAYYQRIRAKWLTRTQARKDT